MLSKASGVTLWLEGCLKHPWLWGPSALTNCSVPQSHSPYGSTLSVADDSGAAIKAASACAAGHELEPCGEFTVLLCLQPVLPNISLQANHFMPSVFKVLFIFSL